MDNLVAEANVLDGTVVHRPMTEEEIVADELNRNQTKEKLEAEAVTKAEAAAAKAALLDKLGITEEEAKLLLS